MIIDSGAACLLVRSADDTDVSDLTAAVRSGAASWLEDGSLSIPFDPEPTDAEQERIRRRLMTPTDDQETRVGKLVAAHAALVSDTSPAAVALRLLIEDRLGPLLP